MVSNSDLQRWQQAIQGIGAAQNELSPEELSAFQTLVECINNGDFDAGESGNNIQIMKKALPQHGKNRLLKAYLTNFTALCEKYFKAKVAPVVASAPASAPVINPPQIIPPVFEQPIFEPPTIQPPTFEPPVFEPPMFEVEPPTFEPPVEVEAQPQPQIVIPDINPQPIVTPQPIVETPIVNSKPAPNESAQSTKAKQSNLKLILWVAAIALLLGGWWVYNNWESGAVLKLRDKLGLAPADTTKNALADSLKQNALVAPKDSVKQAVEVAPDSVKQVVEKTVADTVKKITVQPAASVPSGSSTINKSDEKKKPAPSTASPTISLAKLNGLLNKISNADDNATDEIRSVLGNSLRVEGASNISNVQELITDVSKGNRYKVTKVKTDANGKIVSISVSK